MYVAWEKRKGKNSGQFHENVLQVKTQISKRADNEKKKWSSTPQLSSSLLVTTRTQLFVDNGKTHKRADVIETVSLPFFIRHCSVFGVTLFPVNVIYLEHIDTQEYEPKIQDRLDERTEKNRHDVHWNWKLKKSKTFFWRRNSFFSNFDEKESTFLWTRIHWNEEISPRRITKLSRMFCVLRFTMPKQWLHVKHQTLRGAFLCWCGTTMSVIIINTTKKLNVLK